MGKAQTFRANVGIVVVNDRWEALALDRIDKKALKKGKKQGMGEWQMPQGGLDEGEEPEDAWKRELKEEIGVGAQDVDLLGAYPEWLAYELPKEVREKPKIKAKHGRGPVQKWFFVRIKGGATVDLEPENPKKQEFCDYKWMSLDVLAEETWEVRRPIYRKLAHHISLLKQREAERQGS